MTRRLVAERDPAAVGEHERAVVPGRRRRSRRRRARSPRARVSSTHERDLDQAHEVVALVAAVLARGVGELARERVGEAGEALEVVGATARR